MAGRSHFWPYRKRCGHIAASGRLTARVAKIWADGCAVIRFGVDADGNPTHASVIIANPPATGPAALGIVQQDAYARGDTPGAHFYIRISLSHPATGGSTVSSMLR